MPVSAFPIIIGPTAAGKTALAVELAVQWSGEIISADSMLIYRGLNIGAAKPTPEERRGIPHHLIDIVEPTERFSVSQWLAAATAATKETVARGVQPVVVGGTHLYVKALLDGLFEGPPADDALRARLAALPPDQLRTRLEQVDPVAATRLHPNDIRRTIRAIEVFEHTGRPISDLQQQWDRARDRAGPRPFLVNIEWPVEAINRRINARVRAMIEQGLVEEARALWSAGRLGTQAREALGYKQLADCFEGRCTLEEAIEQIKIETRRFAKNQRTWSRRLRTTPGSLWIDAAAIPSQEWPGLVRQAMDAFSISN